MPAIPHSPGPLLALALATTLGACAKNPALEPAQATSTDASAFLSAALLGTPNDSATARLALIREAPGPEADARWLQLVLPALIEPQAQSTRSAADLAAEWDLDAPDGAQWSTCFGHPEFPAIVQETADGPRSVWLVPDGPIQLKACTVKASADGRSVVALDRAGGVWWAHADGVVEVGQHPDATEILVDATSPRWLTSTWTHDMDGPSNTRFWSPTRAEQTVTLPGRPLALHGPWLVMDIGSVYGPKATLWDVGAESPVRHGGCGPDGPSALEIDRNGVLWAIHERERSATACDLVSGRVLARSNPEIPLPHNVRAAHQLRDAGKDHPDAPTLAALSDTRLTLLRLDGDTIETEVHDLSKQFNRQFARTSNARGVVAVPGGGLAILYSTGAISFWSPTGALRSQPLPFHRPVSIRGSRGQRAPDGGNGVPVVDGAVYVGETRWVPHLVSPVPDTDFNFIRGDTASDGSRSLSQSGPETADGQPTLALMRADGTPCGPPMPREDGMTVETWSADGRYLGLTDQWSGASVLVRTDCAHHTEARLHAFDFLRGFEAGTQTLWMESQGELFNFDLTPGALQDLLWDELDYCLPALERQRTLGESADAAETGHAKCSQAVAYRRPPA